MKAIFYLLGMLFALLIVGLGVHIFNVTGESHRMYSGTDAEITLHLLKHSAGLIMALLGGLASIGFLVAFLGEIARICRKRKMERQLSRSLTDDEYEMLAEFQYEAQLEADALKAERKIIDDANRRAELKNSLHNEIIAVIDAELD